MPTPDPLTGQIIGCCYRVANGLGYGFLEKCYENALAFELRKAKIEVRWLSMNRSKEAAALELDVHDIP